MKLCVIIIFASLCLESFATETRGKLFEELLRDHEGKYSEFEEYFRPRKQKDAIGFIPLPVELKGKSLIQISCSCHKTSNEFFPGAYTLTHAIEDAVVYADYPSQTTPAELVKSTFIKFGLSPLDKMNSIANIKKVADALGLDSLHFGYKNNMLTSIFHPSIVQPWAMAVRELGMVHEQWQAGKRFFKPIFFYSNETVVLLSLISDGQNLSININDPSNKPIHKGSPLFNVARFLADYFSENAFFIMKSLVKIFAVDHTPHLKEMDRQAGFEDETGRIDAYNLLEKLYEDWISNKNNIQIHELNKPLKGLKKLFKFGNSEQVASLIIRIYAAMLDAIERDGNDKADIEKVIKAIRTSAKEQKIFSLSEGPGLQVFERAQQMKMR